MSDAKLPKLTFSTREVAAMLGVSRPTVDRLVADGFLPSIDLGPTRRTLIPAWAIDDLVGPPGPNTTRHSQALGPPEPQSPPRDAA